MELAGLLEEHRDAILDRWFDLIARTYPRLTSEFLAKQKDQFRNPVGYTIREGIGPIFDQLVSATDNDAILRALDGIIRIRSVQEFTPSQAVAFVFDLKTVVRDVVNGHLRGPERWNALADVELRIDRLALLAFEKYTECREQLHEVRHKEIRARAMRQLDRVTVQPRVSEGSECSECKE